jgi:hypothetical protein
MGTVDCAHAKDMKEPRLAASTITDSGCDINFADVMRDHERNKGRAN